MLQEKEQDAGKKWIWFLTLTRTACVSPYVFASFGTLRSLWGCSTRTHLEAFSAVTVVKESEALGKQVYTG